MKYKGGKRGARKKMIREFCIKMMQNSMRNPMVATRRPYLAAFASYGQKHISIILLKKKRSTHPARLVQPGTWYSSEFFLTQHSHSRSLPLTHSIKHTRTHTHTHTHTHTYTHRDTHTYIHEKSLIIIYHTFQP